MSTYAHCLFAALIAATHFLSSTAYAGPEDEAALRAIPATIVNGWNSGKGDIVASVYAEDGTLVAGHGVVTRGRQAIARYHNELFAGSNKDTRLTVHVTNVRFLEEDVAVLQTEGGILWPGETELAPRNRGVQSFVAIKEGDAWRVVLFQNTRILVAQTNK